MTALYQISTNTIIQDWPNATPLFFTIPGETIDVHAPANNWTFGDYMLIPDVTLGSPLSACSYIASTSSSVQTVNGQLTCVITNVYVDPALSDVQANLCSQVDQQAEEIRAMYIGSYVGQTASYILTYYEALQIQANVSATANTYPLNGAQIGINGNTIQDVATATIAQASQWVGLASQIENIRLSTKVSINAANTINNAINAFSAGAWGSI
jgi:hypothetical protein